MSGFRPGRWHMLLLCCLGLSEGLAPAPVQTRLKHIASPLRSSSPRLILADPGNIVRITQLDRTPPPTLVGSAAFAMSHVPNRYSKRVAENTIKASIAATFVASSAAALPQLGKWYSAAAIAAPILTATTTAGLKGVASDLFAQVFVEGRSRIQDLSLSRTMVGPSIVSNLAADRGRPSDRTLPHRSCARAPPHFAGLRLLWLRVLRRLRLMEVQHILHRALRSRLDLLRRRI